MSREIVTDGKHIPEPIKKLDYWVIWDFQSKVPRAPWDTGNCYPVTWGQTPDGDTEPGNPRTHYSQAHAAAGLNPEFLHASFPFPDGPPEHVGPTLLLPHEGEDTPGPDPLDPPLLFIDYDNVVIDGEVSNEVWDIMASIGGPVFASRSLFFGESPGGLHQLAFGTLPGTVRTVNADLDGPGHVEVYYRSRMTGFTWQHVRGSPTDTLPDATDAITELIASYGSDTTKRQANRDPTETAEPPEAARIDPADIPEDTTDDIQHVFAAITNVTPSDITLRSTCTEDTGTRKSWDPSWCQSDSGARLGYDRLTGGDSWIWRQGSHPVDALQVVAREEGITTDVTRYPEGQDFWKAVHRLRERGARIPYYEGENGTHPDVLRLYQEPTNTDDSRKRAIRAALSDR